MHPLLLAIHWPTVGDILLWLVAGSAGLERIYTWIFGGTSKRLEKLEAAVLQFVPSPDIQAKNEELGRQIAENQGKIKTQHDRTEDAINALNGRVQTLEQHNTNLTLLPRQVQKLNTDHAVLAAEVRAVAKSVEKLDEKQDRHHNDLMQAVSNLSYTRGQLQGGQRRPPADNS